MKLFLFLLIAAFATRDAMAQEPCGNELPPELQDWYKTRMAFIQQQSQAKKPTTSLYVPVHIHIIGNNAGVGHFLKANAYGLVCELNQRYAPLQISFFLEGPVTYIDSDSYYNPSMPYVNQLMNSYNVPKACNIYMVPGLTGLCGFAYQPNSGPAMGRGGIVLKNSCALPGNSDPTHEMGHYFSLVHTFQDYNTGNAEFVNGTNCATAGDLLCDTHADYRDFRWNCPYATTINDPNGDPYMPDSSLYMGYANAPCPTRFSPMQQSAIIYSRENDRPYLDSVAVPAFVGLDMAALLFPADGATGVPSSNNALFSWKAVPGATEYNLRIKLSTSSDFQNSSVINVVTADTFFLVNGLMPAKTYDWKVIPVNYASTCIACDSNNAEVRSFSVVYATGVAEASGNITALKLFPDPAMEEATLEVAVQLPIAATLSVVSMNGLQVFKGEYNLHAGINRLTIAVRRFSAGIYAVSLTSGSFHVTQKLTVKN